MDWLNLIVLLVLVAGHTELLVTVVNHVHGHRLHHRLLRHIRHSHDVLIPAFPIVLFWFVGFPNATSHLGRNLYGHYGAHIILLVPTLQGTKRHRPMNGSLDI